ncbi:MAG: hypothetical protein HC820_00340 [Hydrococcus sp. RM1_1_31]|nr:hypothetical protein [Hydrococcus sp. RM1_1_31]
MTGRRFFSAERNGIQAVTVSRVGTLATSTTDAEFYVEIAESYGLDVYPRAVTLAKGVERQLMVGLEETFSQPNLTSSQTGTRYFVSNPKVISVTSNGLMTTLEEGIADVTVIHGGAEEIIPVRVEKPHLGATTLGSQGGIVQASDGSMVMIPEIALLEETTVDFTPLKANELSLPLPDGFNFAGAFNLDLGEEDSLLLPAQIAIPAPVGLAVGTEVYFMRKGEMPDETGKWNPMWILEETGKVAKDGMIRTASPPYPGMTQKGEYAVFYSSPTGNASIVKGRVNIEYQFPPAFYGILIPSSYLPGSGTNASFGIALKTFANFKNSLISIATKLLGKESEAEAKIDKVAGYIKQANSLAEFTKAVTQDKDISEISDKLLQLADDLGLNDTNVGELLLNTDQYFSIPAFQVSYDISSVKVVQVPSVGLPVITTANVELNPDGIRTFETTLNLPSTSTASDPFAPPVLQKAQLKFTDNKPLIVLTGSNFAGASALSSADSADLKNLTVSFQVGESTYEKSIFSFKNLGNNQYEVEVEPFNHVPLGNAKISLTRKQSEQYGSNPNDYQVSLYESNSIRLEAETGYVFNALSFEDKVAVFEGVNPEAVVEATSSNDLLKARIPVGSPDVVDNAKDLAITKDGSRAYVTLEWSGRIALIDPLLLQPIDTKPETAAIDSIDLPANAKPLSIVIDQRDRYAYIADGRSNLIYVLDIDPYSETYHQVVQNIQVTPAPIGLRQLAISSDGKKLFATAPNTRGVGKSQIIVINIDPQDKPLEESQNSRKWHEQISAVEAEQAAEGLTASSNPKIITFTNRYSDGKGYGVLKITNDDPLNFAATTSYSELILGSIYDYFDVNEAVSITLTKDNKYAFVAGYNGSLFGSGIESIDGVQAGSNIGIIENPLGSNPLLIAATRPIPLGLTSDLVLSNDDKYLYASYPTGGGMYVFDVEEIIETLDNPRNYLIDEVGRPLGSRFFNPNTQRRASLADLASIPIDDINPAISVAADFGIIVEDRVRNQFTYGKFPDTKRAPINPGAFTRGLAVAPTDIVDLIGPGDSTSDSTPTLAWSFDIPNEKVQEVNLFVSTFGEGEGLLPWDETVDLDNPKFLEGLSEAEKRQLLTKRWNGYDDFNPGRILTATWKKATNTWYWRDGKTVIAQGANEPQNNNTRLTLPEELTLTAGQKYYWAVQAVSTTGETDTESSYFRTTSPYSNNPFSSVTVITHGFTQSPSATGIPDTHYDLANKIISVNGDKPNEKGLILRYHKNTGLWIPTDKDGRVLEDVTGGLNPGDTNYLSTLATNLLNDYAYKNKPLVLLSEWSLNRESVIPDSGFTEGAADAIFASLVQFDQGLRGDAYFDNKGQFVTTHGAIFDSPLHFIGFSRGTVVTSELVQRVGTYFPYAGGPIDAQGEPVKDAQGKPIRDLQMTTIDPHDFDQPSLGPFRDFREPKVQYWENVTFADNYYQDLANPNGLVFNPEWSRYS